MQITKNQHQVPAAYYRHGFSLNGAVSVFEKENGIWTQTTKTNPDRITPINYLYESKFLDTNFNENIFAKFIEDKAFIKDYKNWSQLDEAFNELKFGDDSIYKAYSHLLTSALDLIVSFPFRTKNFIDKYSKIFELFLEEDSEAKGKDFINATILSLIESNRLFLYSKIIEKEYSFAIFMTKDLELYITSDRPVIMLTDHLHLTQDPLNSNIKAYILPLSRRHLFVIYSNTKFLKNYFQNCDLMNLYQSFNAKKELICHPDNKEYIVSKSLINLTKIINYDRNIYNVNLDHIFIKNKFFEAFNPITSMLNSKWLCFEHEQFFIISNNINNSYKIEGPTEENFKKVTNRI